MKNYATSIEKNRELTKLTSKIKRVQATIARYEVNVTIITQKQAVYLASLADAKINRDNADANAKYGYMVFNGIKETIKSMDTVVIKTNGCETGINTVSKDISKLIRQLIYAMEMVDALSVTINKKKAANILIPDDLVKAITSVSGDANNAVALCLTALESCHLAMVKSGQTTEMTILERCRSYKLYNLITGHEGKVNQDELKKSIEDIKKEIKGIKNEKLPSPLLLLLDDAKNETEKRYKNIEDDKAKIDNELSESHASLEREMAKLESLKSGLDAAKAVALAV